MSFVDYGQTAEDHQSLLVLVRHTGSHLPVSLFNRIWERIHTLSVVHIQGQNRNVTVRYKRVYPVENNQWGDFQAHRKVLGLISVGKCVDHEEFTDLFENYKKVMALLTGNPEVLNTLNKVAQDGENSIPYNNTTAKFSIAFIALVS